MRLAAALLAAGASTRFGRPKALLLWRGESFVRRLARELAAVAEPVLVVVPPAADAMLRELADGGTLTVVNPRPETGMGGSLAAAVRELRRRAPACEGVLVALVDQPLASRDQFALLAQAAAAGSGWAASDYGDGVCGPPAVLPRAAFDEIERLEEDRGARALLARAGVRVARVPFADGRWDVDSPADYERLLASAAARGGGDDA